MTADAEDENERRQECERGPQVKHEFLLVKLILLRKGTVSAGQGD